RPTSPASRRRCGSSSRAC
ncbi:MAG: ammonia channel, partial [Betaproteobacteria bacterium]